MPKPTLCAPLKKSASLTQDSESFKGVDFSAQTELPIAPHPGAFAIERANHYHEGVDLYGEAGDEVFAMEDGEVVFNGPFTGPKAGSEWWLDTDAVAVSGAHGVVFYGEMVPEPLPVGSQVRAGDLLGRLSRVLRKDKGRPLHMLHVELYEPGARASCGIWEKGQPRPQGLLDPTPMLRAALGIEPEASQTPPASPRPPGP